MQNFADAGKALYRVARKYASKVTFYKNRNTFFILYTVLFCTVIILFLSFKLSIQLNKYFCSWQAEENPMKKELLRYVDKIPAYCHQLMFTSRSLAVGQSACCRKVRDARSVGIKKEKKIFNSQHCIFSIILKRYS